MRSFKKFVEECEAINEAEYNKEWWDSKSDSFKKRYIERHPNSIYAQKASSKTSSKKDAISVNDLEKIRNKSGNVSLNKLRGLLGKPKLKPRVDEKPHQKSPSQLNKELWGKSVPSREEMLAMSKKSNPETLFKVGITLLDSPHGGKKYDDNWYDTAKQLMKNPNTPKDIIRRFENEESNLALYSPKVSKQFLDNQIEYIEPADYKWNDLLIKNPALSEKQKLKLMKKLQRGLNELKGEDLNDPQNINAYRKKIQTQIKALEPKHNESVIKKSSTPHFGPLASRFGF